MDKVNKSCSASFKTGGTPLLLYNPIQLTAYLLLLWCCEGFYFGA